MLCVLIFRGFGVLACIILFGLQLFLFKCLDFACLVVKLIIHVGHVKSSIPLHFFSCSTKYLLLAYILLHLLQIKHQFQHQDLMMNSLLTELMMRIVVEQAFAKFQEVTCLVHCQLTQLE